MIPLKRQIFAQPLSRMKQRKKTLRHLKKLIMMGFEMKFHSKGQEYLWIYF